MAAVFTCDIWNKYNNKTLYSKSGTCPNLSKHMHQILFKLVMPTNLARLTKIETEDISCILFLNFSFASLQHCFSSLFIYFTVSHTRKTPPSSFFFPETSAVFFFFKSWSPCMHIRFFFYVNRHFISMYPTLRNCYVAVIIIVSIINLYFFKFLVMLLR